MFEEVAFSIQINYGLQRFRNLFRIMYFIEAAFFVVG